METATGVGWLEEDDLGDGRATNTMMPRAVANPDATIKTGSGGRLDSRARCRCISLAQFNAANSKPHSHARVPAALILPQTGH